MTVRVALYLFDEVEVLDFAGPFEVLSTASRVERKRTGYEPFEVLTVAREPRVRARGGLAVAATHGLTDHPPADVLLVPGGDVTAELERPEAVEWIRRNAPSARLVASICTGAFLLARAGLLDGLRVTTHWEDADDLARQFPALRVEPAHRWIDEGRIVTSAGISAGLDMSLHLVERLTSRELAVATARQMDYEWRPSK